MEKVALKLRKDEIRQKYLDSWPGGSLGKSLDLPKRQETIVSGCARREDSEHRLNKLQRRVRAAAISVDKEIGMKC